MFAAKSAMTMWSCFKVSYWCDNKLFLTDVIRFDQIS